MQAPANFGRVCLEGIRSDSWSSLHEHSVEALLVLACGFESVARIAYLLTTGLNAGVQRAHLHLANAMDKLRVGNPLAAVQHACWFGLT